MKERRDEPSGGWGLVSINNDEIERHNATVCKNRVIVVSANVKYESQLGNAFTTVDSRKAISGIVTRKRFLLGASEPQCKMDLYRERSQMTSDLTDPPPPPPVEGFLQIFTKCLIILYCVVKLKHRNLIILFNKFIKYV